jgi:hypothetical protein
MSAETLSMVAKVIPSLTSSYVPGINVKFSRLSDEHKRLILLEILVLVSLGILGISCIGSGELFDLRITRDQAGLIDLIKVLVVAIVANQGVYTICPKTKHTRKLIK